MEGTADTIRQDLPQSDMIWYHLAPSDMEGWCWVLLSLIRDFIAASKAQRD